MVIARIGADTSEVHQSSELYLDAERTGKDMKTIVAMGLKRLAWV